MKAKAASLHFVSAGPGGAHRLLREVQAGLKADGLIHAQAVGTSTLTVPTPWRWGVMCAWTSVAAVAPLELAGGRTLVPQLTLTPRHVRGTWRGVDFIAAPAKQEQEQERMVGFVYGRLRARHAPAFALANVIVARRARRADGFGHGMGLFESPLRFASLSTWDSGTHLREFAHRDQRHRGAALRYRAAPWADDHAVVRFAVVGEPRQP